MLYLSLNEGTPIAEAVDALELRYFRLDSRIANQTLALTEWLTVNQLAR